MSKRKVPSGRGVAVRTKCFLVHGFDIASRCRVIEIWQYLLIIREKDDRRVFFMSVNEKNRSILGKDYWFDAAKQFSNVKIIAVAAIIIALRLAVKLFKIPLATDLFLTFDCYVNAVGSFIYGPLVGLAVGAVSDTIGAIVMPTGAYFFPFIFVEMFSSFIFGLFLWKRPLTVVRTVMSKFTVNFVCNIIMNSILMKWYYTFFGIDKVYPFINVARIVKSLVLFPLEGALIFAVLQAVLPALKPLGLTDKIYFKQKITAKHIVLMVVLTLLSIGLVLFYYLFLKEFISAHNFKFL